VSQYDAIAGRYDEHFARPVDRWEDERLAALLAPLVDGRDVLDLGCGTGWLADHTTPAFYTGVDCSAPMLATLAAKHPDAVLIKATVGKPGWQSAITPEPGLARYDAITATWALQYLGDLAVLLRLLPSMLRPGGVIALHGYLPRYRRRSHEITGEDRPVVDPWAVRAATRDAGLPPPLITGTGALPDRLAVSRGLWAVTARAPARWHYAALWTWRLR
jgi:trans-aconitate methyltransferase